MNTVLGIPCTFSDVCNNNTAECNLLTCSYVIFVRGFTFLSLNHIL